MMKLRALIPALALMLLAAPAHAVTLNASLHLGGSLLTGSAAAQMEKLSPIVGGDLTFDLGTYVEVGAFFDHNFISYSDQSSGTLRFYGLMMRLGLLGNGSNLYLDTQLGLSQRSVGLGAGIGYRVWLLPYLSVSPRLGVRILPEPFEGTRSSSTTADGTLLLTFGF